MDKHFVGEDSSKYVPVELFVSMVLLKESVLDDPSSSQYTKYLTPESSKSFTVEDSVEDRTVLVMIDGLLMNEPSSS